MPRKFLHERERAEERKERERQEGGEEESAMKREALTRRDHEVVDFTRYRVKNISELTNLMKMYRIEGYNCK